MTTGNNKLQQGLMTAEHYLNAILGGLFTVLFGVFGYIMNRSEKRIAALEDWRLHQSEKEHARFERILTELTQLRAQNEYLTRRVDEIVTQINA